MEHKKFSNQGGLFETEDMAGETHQGEFSGRFENDSIVNRNRLGQKKKKHRRY